MDRGAVNGRDGDTWAEAPKERTSEPFECPR